MEAMGSASGIFKHRLSSSLSQFSGEFYPIFTLDDLDQALLSPIVYFKQKPFKIKHNNAKTKHLLPEKPQRIIVKRVHENSN